MLNYIARSYNVTSIHYNNLNHGKGHPIVTGLHVHLVKQEQIDQLLILFKYCDTLTLIIQYAHYSPILELSFNIM